MRQETTEFFDELMLADEVQPIYGTHRMLVLVTDQSSAEESALYNTISERMQNPNTYIHVVVPVQTNTQRSSQIDAISKRDAEQIVDYVCDHVPPDVSYADGEVGQSDPLTAVEDAINAGPWDELIVSARTNSIAEIFNIDLISKLQPLITTTHVQKRFIQQ